MAKIDTTKIEGYDTMTPEQKVAALEAVEYEDNSAELERAKAAVTKANSEAAEWKRKHNAFLTEEEQKKQAASEELATLRQKVEELEKEKTISGHVAQLLELGYDKALATETAEAMANGELAKVFVNQKIFLENHDKAYKAKLMGETSTPPAGNTGRVAVDYTKLIEEAKAASNFEAVAYYTRLEQEAENQN